MCYIVSMEKRSEKNPACAAFLWCSVVICVLGAVAIQLSGAVFSYLHFPEVSDQGNCEALTAVVSNSLPVSRHFRTTRYRNAPSGRLNNLRSSGDGANGFAWQKTELFSCGGIASKENFFSADNDNFWIDFIISAFPVRAGPIA